jgi:hypothetical protein
LAVSQSNALHVPVDWQELGPVNWDKKLTYSRSSRLIREADYFPVQSEHTHALPRVWSYPAAATSLHTTCHGLFVGSTGLPVFPRRDHMDWFLVLCLLTIFRYTRNWYNINERFFSDFRIATILDVPIFYEKQKLRFKPPSIMSSHIPTVSVPWNVLIDMVRDCSFRLHTLFFPVPYASWTFRPVPRQSSLYSQYTRFSPSLSQQNELFVYHPTGEIVVTGHVLVYGRSQVSVMQKRYIKYQIA